MSPWTHCVGPSGKARCVDGAARLGRHRTASTRRSARGLDKDAFAPRPGPKRRSACHGVWQVGIDLDPRPDARAPSGAHARMKEGKNAPAARAAVGASPVAASARGAAGNAAGSGGGSMGLEFRSRGVRGGVTARGPRSGAKR